MNNFLKALSIFGMVLCGSMGVTDLMTKQYALAIVMAACFFLNLYTFISCLKRDQPI